MLPPLSRPTGQTSLARLQAFEAKSWAGGRHVTLEACAEQLQPPVWYFRPHLEVDAAEMKVSGDHEWILELRLPAAASWLALGSRCFARLDLVLIPDAALVRALWFL